MNSHSNVRTAFSLPRSRTSVHGHATSSETLCHMCAYSPVAPLLTGFMTVAGNGISISQAVTFRHLALVNYTNVLYVVKPASPRRRSNDIWDATWKNWPYLRCPDL